MSIAKTLGSNDVPAANTARYEQSISEQSVASTVGVVRAAPTAVDQLAPPTPDSDLTEGGQIMVAFVAGGASEVEQAPVLELQQDASVIRYNLTRALEADSTLPSAPASFTYPTPDPLQLLMYRETGIDPAAWTPFTGEDWNKEIINRVHVWFSDVQYGNSRAEWGMLGEAFGQGVLKTLSYTRKLLEFEREADKTIEEPLVVALVGDPAAEMTVAAVAVVVDPSAGAETEPIVVVINAATTGNESDAATTTSAAPTTATPAILSSVVEAAADAGLISEEHLILIPWLLREALEIPRELLRMTGFDDADCKALQDALDIASGLLSLSVGTRYGIHARKSYTMFEANSKIRDDSDQYYREAAAQSNRREAELRDLLTAGEAADERRDEQLNRLREYLKQIDAKRAKHQGRSVLQNVNRQDAKS